MSRSTTSERLRRYNVLLTDAESAWLDQLAEEILAATGARVSRSQIVRAAIAGLRELSKLAPELRLPALTHCRSGADMAMLTVLAAQCASTKVRS